MTSSLSQLYNSDRPKLSGRVFLVTYRPLQATAMGRDAIKRHDTALQRGYIDHSCRREPDFLHPNPLITGLCRKEKFAPKLKAGDVVVYLAKENLNYRLAAILYVLLPLSTHHEAAQLYISAGQKLPSNCMIKENYPLQLNETGGKAGEVQSMKKLLHCGSEKEQQRAIRQWDGYYWSIVNGNSAMAAVQKVVITEPLFLSLTNPPTVTSADLIEAFGPSRGGGVPGTQTPSGKHTISQLDALLVAAGLSSLKQLLIS